MSSRLCEFLVAANFTRSPWLAGGDANEEPLHSCIAPVLQQHNGECLQTGMHTRWNGRQKLDWLMTNKPLWCGRPEVNHDLCLSDHKAVKVQVNTQWSPTQRYRFCLQPSWRRPTFVDEDHGEIC